MADDEPKSEEEYRELRERWERQIVRFMLLFGDIEYHIDRCLIDIPTENAYPAARKLQFKGRASAAIRVVQQRLPDDNHVRSKLLDAISRAQLLARERDVIAHNPMHLAVYQDDDGQLSFRLAPAADCARRSRRATRCGSVRSTQARDRLAGADHERRLLAV